MSRNHEYCLWVFLLKWNGLEILERVDGNRTNTHWRFEIFFTSPNSSSGYWISLFACGGLETLIGALKNMMKMLIGLIVEENRFQKKK